MFWKIVKYAGAAIFWTVTMPAFLLLLIISIVCEVASENLPHLKLRRRFCRLLNRLGHYLSRKCPECGGDMYEVDVHLGRPVYKCTRCGKEFI